MAAENGNRSQLEQPLLSERHESFTFRPASAPESHFLTVDVDGNESSRDRESIFKKKRSGSFTGEGFISRTPGHFNSQNSGLSRDADDENNGNEDEDSRQDGEEDQKEKKREEKKESRSETRRKSRQRRSLRNPITKKSLVKRATHTATHEPIFFLKSVLWGLILWPLWTWKSIQRQSSLTIISLKSGIAAGLASIICVVNFPPPYDELSSIAIWAVVTIDILYEGNIGLSLSKGVNRVAGTLCAGALAVFLTQVGPDVPDHLYPYYVVFWVFVGGFAFRFLKGIPPLKDQWGYAFTVATIAFHILLLSSFLQPERVTLPILRFAMILLGFFLASIINLAFKPVYAGDTLHALVAKNFDTAASILSRCVTEYSNYTMLDHVPDILSGRSEDDKIHQSYHEIVMSDSDIDKLLGAVTWEPCHGAFFAGYPWHLYDDITDYLRYTLYDVIALDSCLRASIQAPKSLRSLFIQEMKEIAEECAKVLILLANSMRNMTTVASEDDVLSKAEEAALALQNKIYIHTHELLGTRAAESPRYSLYVASCLDPKRSSAQRIIEGGNDSNDRWVRSEAEKFDEYYENRPNIRLARTRTEEEIEYGNGFPGLNMIEYGNGFPGSPPPGANSGDDSGIDRTKTGAGENASPSESFYEKEHAVLSDWQDSPHLSRNNSIQLNRSGPTNITDTPGVVGRSESAPHETLVGPRQGSQSILEGIQVGDDVRSRSLKTTAESGEVPKEVPGLAKAKYQNRGWRQTFKKRRSNLQNDYDGAEDRISALSLVKFASLLIEVVAKMKYVVMSVQELGEQAKFKKIVGHEHFEPSLRSGIS